MEARLSKLLMAKPIHPSIHVGLTGGGAYHSGLRSHLAPYLFSVGKSNYQLPARTSLVYLSLWKEATACSFPLPVAKIVPPQSQGTVFPQQEELTRYYSIRSLPSCSPLQRRRWAKKEKRKPLRQQRRERNIYRLCVIQTVIVIPANKPSQTGFKGGASPPAGGYTMRASIIYKRSAAMIMFQAR